MDSQFERRDFIRWAALAGAAAAAEGCASAFRLAPGGAASGFRMKPMERVRVGMLGVGSRGTAAVRRLVKIEGVEIVAVCDLVGERVERARKMVRDAGRGSPAGFVGPEGWKAICDAENVDVVYNCTSWDWHLRPCVRAMLNGKVPLVEVPGTLRIDECWEYVETCEKTRIPCMMLENCVYGEDEMLMLNLVRSGVLGDIVHGEGGYVHYGAEYMYPKTDSEPPTWRLEEKKGHTGNAYPTHGLGPVALSMGVNRGDRFDYMVSVGSRGHSLQDFARRKFGPDSKFGNYRIDYNDVNTSAIRTAVGNTIMVQINCANPRPYTRMGLVVGTKGIFGTYPARALLETAPGVAGKTWMDEKELAALREKYAHPLWKRHGELAKKVGGHGGMDFLMDLRWVYCLRKGLPLDMDVYDLASWSAVCELSESSAKRRGRTEYFPDFTRGGWKAARPVDIGGVAI